MKKAVFEEKLIIKCGRHRTHIKDNLVPVVNRNPNKPIQKRLIGKSKYEESNYKKRNIIRKCVIQQMCYNSFELEKMSFVTFTFDPKKADEHVVKDLNYVQNQFRKFIRRMNYQYDDFEYVTVFARQKKGNWHFHMICNIDGSISENELVELWRYGSVEIILLEDKGNLDKRIRYMQNNMLGVKNELKGKKGYLASKNAKADKIIDLNKLCEENPEEVEKIANKIMQSLRVNKMYNVDKEIGIMKQYKNDNSDEVESYVEFGEKLTKELIDKGYTHLKYKQEVYSVDAVFAEYFPPIKTATLKTKKTKK